ncbi:MAG: MATE family efflux transporter, partial [Anaerolineaceae bacterium]|nr:MATE family efflux transporter [Anaerolineaceae bacterium]
MKMEKSSARDLTSGSIHKNIWFLAVPMTLEFGVMSISQLMDTYWVGRLGSAALAAVTISTSIRWVINSMANGLGNGGMAVVARRTGEQNRAAAAQALWQTILLGIFVSLLLAIPGILLARPLLSILGADSDVLPL